MPNCQLLGGLSAFLPLFAVILTLYTPCFMPSPRPRPAVKAVILENDHLLALKMRDTEGIYYKLPGGGQDAFETMSEALMRECAEEVGLQVRVGSLLWLADHIIHLPHYQKSSQAHQTEAFFRCYIHGTATPQAGNVPDEGQIGIVWLPLAQLPQLRLYPIDLRPLLAQLNTAQTDNLASYLGKIS